MTPSHSNGKQSIRHDVRQKVVSRVTKAKAAQPKVAIRASSRLKKKDIIQNRSAVFPGTKAITAQESFNATVYLPDDVVINIFSIYLSSMEYHHKGQYNYPGFRATPFFLASVAFAWSRIVRSTPSLWKNLDLHLDPLRYKYQVKLLGQWLDYTSGCELSVSVLTHIESIDHWSRHVPRGIYDIVESRASQITDLSLTLFPDFYTRRMSGFNNLQRLRLDGGQRHLWAFPNEAVFEIDAPGLTQLQTCWLNPGFVRIVDAEGNDAPLGELKSFSSQISYIHATYNHLITRQMQSHSSFNQLTHLDISSGINTPVGHYIPVNAPLLRFPQLLYLRCTSFADIVSHIDYAPLLSTLVCFIPETIPHRPEYLAHAIQFLANVSCAHLQTFTFWSANQVLYLDEVQVYLLLRLHPSLRDVSIVGVAYEEGFPLRHLSDNFLNIVCTPNSELDHDLLGDRLSAVEIVAPHLRSFTYHGPTKADNFNPSTMYQSLIRRASLYPMRYAAECPLRRIWIYSTTKIAKYDHDDSVLIDMADHIRSHFVNLSFTLLDDRTNDEAHNFEKLWVPPPPEVKYVTRCDHPLNVDPNKSFDNQFFELRYVTPLDEQTTYAM